MTVGSLAMTEKKCRDRSLDLSEVDRPEGLSLREILRFAQNDRK